VLSKDGTAKMQVTETLVDGLKREFNVVVPATELDSRLVERLSSLKDEVRIKGFRPGKVPMSHLKRLFGRSAMAEIVQDVIAEVARNTLSERGEKAAMQPDYRLPTDDTETGEVLSGNHDLTYTMAYEVLPKIELVDFKTLSIERPVVEVTDEEVEEQLKRLADSTRSYTTKEGAAENGDRVTMSYVGKIDGVPFDGGTDDNGTVVLGDGRFIPGFEEQLVGLSTGDKKTITVTFPEDYGASNLAGKEATFDIEVKAVASGDEVAIDDKLAERLGLESLQSLRDTVRQQIQSQDTQAVRQRVKRALLDQLDETHHFELPQRMVEQEFESIWRQIVGELGQSGRSFEDEGTTEEKARDEYQKIAERRVRLGLVMSEIGDRAKVEVADEEVQRAMAAHMRQFPGQEEMLLDYYRKNPDAVAALRAPIFEEKVVDYLLELVNVTDKPMTRAELAADDEEDGSLV
jgi:trigger factor